MGQLSFGVQSAAPAVNASVPKAFTDAHMQRLYAMIRGRYNFNPNGTVSSDGQALNMWIDKLVGDIIADVRAWEQNEASRAITTIAPQ